MPVRVILVVAALSVLGGCERTPTDTIVPGPMQFTEFSYDGAIPADYGRLVAVTSSDAYPGWAQLWFERPDSSIVAVFLDYQNGRVRDKVLEVPRS